MIDVILQATPEMIHNWGWFLAFGIVLVLLGIGAIVRSVTSTVVSMMFFGWILVFAGLIQFVEAFMVGRWAGFFLHLLIAILFAIAGVVMLTRPVISAEAVTLVMSMFFLIGGLYEFIAALWTHLHGWGWQALNGVISFILGVLILAQWPVTGLWVIGLFVGIDLLFYGWAWITLALDLHKM
ncbi:MAG: HdeD family acid-resistance protein [Candidatus Acidiferrales bacterium]